MTFRSLPCSLLLCAAIGAQASSPFVDESTRLPSDVREGVTGLLVDLNLDQHMDLIHVEAQGFQAWLQDPGSGRFVRTASLTPVPVVTQIVAAATGRLTPGDAFQDLVLALANGQTLLFAGDGQGGFTLRPGAFPIAAQGAASAVLVADLDKMISEDVVLLFDGKKPQVLRGTATGVFTDVSPSLPNVALAQPDGVLVDLDMNGYPDLVISAGVAGVPVLLLNSGGSFTLGTVPVSPGPLPPIGRVVAADLNLDLLPDLVFGALASAGPQAPLVFRNLGNARFAQVTGAILPITGVLDLAVGDLDGMRGPDLVVLQPDGVVATALNMGGGVLGPGPILLAEGPRVALAAGDIDRDGDVDVYVEGGANEHRLLLGGSGMRFFDTEVDAFPLGATPAAALGALADVNQDGDRDVVVFTALGAAAWYQNLGDARFALGVAGAVPTLPGSTTWFRIESAAITKPSYRAEILALGVASATNPTGVRVLIAQNGNLVDATATRWPAGIGAASALAVGSIVSPTLSDVVIADAAGKLMLLANQGGTFVLQPNAFPPFLAASVRHLLLGLVNGDALLDLVVIDANGKLQVYLGAAGGTFVAGPVPIGGVYAGRDALLDDLDGDGFADLLLVTPGLAQGVSLLLGVGDGHFVDQSAQLPNRVPANASCVESIGRGAVIGALGNPSVFLDHLATGFALTTVPYRGSLRVQDLLVGDLDTDGDLDIVELRVGSHPRLVRAGLAQLTQPGVCQGGRQLTLRLRGPANALGFVFFAPATTRIVFPPYGILRLAGLTPLMNAPLSATGNFEISFPTQPVAAALDLPLQAAIFEPSTSQITLGNLLHVRIVDF